MSNEKNLPEKPEKFVDLPKKAEETVAPAQETKPDINAPKLGSEKTKESTAAKSEASAPPIKKTPAASAASFGHAVKKPARAPRTGKSRQTAKPAGGKAEKPTASLKSAGRPLEASEAGFQVYVESSNALAEGLEAIGAEWMDFAQKAVEANISAAQALAEAKTLDEVVELQARFTSRNIDNLLAESAKLTELSLESVLKAWQPISGRSTKDS